MELPKGRGVELVSYFPKGKGVELVSCLPKGGEEASLIHLLPLGEKVARSAG